MGEYRQASDVIVTGLCGEKSPEKPDGDVQEIDIDAMPAFLHPLCRFHRSLTLMEKCKGISGVDEIVRMFIRELHKFDPDNDPMDENTGVLIMNNSGHAHWKSGSLYMTIMDEDGSFVQFHFTRHLWNRNIISIVSRNHNDIIKRDMMRTSVPFRVFQNLYWVMSTTALIMSEMILHKSIKRPLHVIGMPLMCRHRVLVLK